MRLEFQTPNLDVSRATLQQAFGDVVGRRFDMQWHISYAADRPRMAILVSRHDHALMELLWRWQRGELRVEVPVVISNHPDLREAVERFGVRFEHVPIDAATHADAEARMQGLLHGQADVLVLALSLIHI